MVYPHTHTMTMTMIMILASLDMRDGTIYNQYCDTNQAITAKHCHWSSIDIEID